MRFTPKSEKEIAEAGLFPPGVYDFEVLTAEETVSKNGNEMIKLAIRVYDEQGETTVVFDYLLDALAGKLRHAAEAFNLLHQYEHGGINAEDCVGKTGKCKLAIQKDKTGQFPDRNGIADYIPAPRNGLADRVDTRPRSKAKAEGLDDEVPF